jgi:hypothetical protein
MPKHHGFIESALLSSIEALLLHGEIRPLTDLQPEQPARLPRSEGLRWIRQIAVSGQTPNPFRVFACDARVSFI